MARNPLQSKHCPPKLARVIELVNLFKPGVRLPVLSVRSQLANFRGRKAKQEKAKWTMRARLDLDKCLKEAPDDFRQFIYGNPDLQIPFFVDEYSADLFDSTIEAVKRYEDFTQLRAQLLRLIRFVKSHNLRRRDDSRRIHVPLPFLLKPVLDENGFIRIGGSLLLEALPDIEANRIRECAECNRIFWAKNINQLCCDPKCANRRRVRRSRDLQRENWLTYKLNRSDKEPEAKKRAR
jgi:hypothetical protein